MKGWHGLDSEIWMIEKSSQARKINHGNFLCQLLTIVLTVKAHYTKARSAG